MSNRIGVLQSKIFRLLAEGNGQAFVRDTLPDNFSNSQYVSQMRAARLLEKRGFIKLTRVPRGERRCLLATRTY